LATEDSRWDHRRIHGELALLGIKIAASTVRELLTTAGIAPAPQRTAVILASFLRCQAEAILAMDFIETVTLTGQRQYILAVIHHISGRVRILGTTAHATYAWVTQAISSLLMDLEDTGNLERIRYLIHDRDATHPELIDQIRTRSLAAAAPLRALPQPRESAQIDHRSIRRRTPVSHDHCLSSVQAAITFEV
jgi:hypothetical protein